MANVNTDCDLSSQKNIPNISHTIKIDLPQECYTDVHYSYNNIKNPINFKANNILDFLDNEENRKYMMENSNNVVRRKIPYENNKDCLWYLKNCTLALQAGRTVVNCKKILDNKNSMIINSQDKISDKINIDIKEKCSKMEINTKILNSDKCLLDINNRDINKCNINLYDQDDSLLVIPYIYAINILGKYVHRFTAITDDMQYLYNMFIDFFHNHVIDRSMERALEISGNLNWWTSKDQNENHPSSKLWVINTTRDGNCLLHAISLALYGHEDNALELRKLLFQTLLNDNDDQSKNISNNELMFPGGPFQRRWKYRQMLLNQQYGLSLCPDEWDREWSAILNQSAPIPCTLKKGDVNSERNFGSNHGNLQNTHTYLSLEEIHIYVMANILNRTIIVVSPDYLNDINGKPLSPITFGGIYLPQDFYIQNSNGNITSNTDQSVHKRTPIIIAYESSHFSPLVIMDIDLPENSIVRIPLFHQNHRPLPIQFPVDPYLLQNEDRIADFNDSSSCQHRNTPYNHRDIYNCNNYNTLDFRSSNSKLCGSSIKKKRNKSVPPPMIQNYDQLSTKLFNKQQQTDDFEMFNTVDRFTPLSDTQLDYQSLLNSYLNVSHIKPKLFELKLYLSHSSHGINYNHVNDSYTTEIFCDNLMCKFENFCQSNIYNNDYYKINRSYKEIGNKDDQRHITKQTNDFNHFTPLENYQLTKDFLRINPIPSHSNQIHRNGLIPSIYNDTFLNNKLDCYTNYKNIHHDIDNINNFKINYHTNTDCSANYLSDKIIMSQVNTLHNHRSNHILNIIPSSDFKGALDDKVQRSNKTYREIGKIVDWCLTTKEGHNNKIGGIGSPLKTLEWDKLHYDKPKIKVPDTDRDKSSITDDNNPVYKKPSLILAARYCDISKSLSAINDCVLNSFKLSPVLSNDKRANYGNKEQCKLKIKGGDKIDITKNKNKTNANRNSTFFRDIPWTRDLHKPVEKKNTRILANFHDTNKDIKFIRNNKDTRLYALQNINNNNSNDSPNSTLSPPHHRSLCHPFSFHGLSHHHHNNKRNSQFFAPHPISSTHNIFEPIQDITCHIETRNTNNDNNSNLDKHILIEIPCTNDKALNNSCRIYLDNIHPEDSHPNLGKETSDYRYNERLLSKFESTLKINKNGLALAKMLRSIKHKFVHSHRAQLIINGLLLDCNSAHGCADVDVCDANVIGDNLLDKILCNSSFNNGVLIKRSNSFRLLKPKQELLYKESP
ncbi:uncharacterized protein LOC135926016 isoform X2 [Gordionus sp. m RMFG-2023]|uniref:uncharacterized protein LOC135926016 isoform X2 n=1 Tax=Gordionus sp. m RMFG-2023 TaxID=3053472 RepID=UPI0031FBF443